METSTLHISTSLTMEEWTLGITILMKQRLRERINFNNLDEYNNMIIKNQCVHLCPSCYIYIILLYSNMPVSTM